MLNRIVILSIIVGLLSACQKTPSQQQWVQFTLPDQSLTLKFPAMPKSQKKAMRFPKKTEAQSFHYELVNNNVAYSFTVYPIPEEVLEKFSARQILNNARNGGLLKSGGLLIDEQKIRLAGNEGLKVQVRSADDTQIINSQFYVINKRFVIMVTASPANQYRATEVLKYMNSLQLKK